MTEQEIIKYLKENEKEGRVLWFMPEEVKRWCVEHRKELFVWQSDRWYQFKDDYICMDAVVTLPDDYKVEKESKGEWIEYDVKEGRFYEETRGIFYAWHEWSKCMSDNPRFTGFGGWLFDESGDWVLSPQVGLIDDSGNAPFILNRYSYSYEKERIIPVIPIKIRFWKG